VKINIFNSEEETIEGLARYFAILANEAIDTKGRCAVALSGGNSPKRLYELLSSPLFKDQIPWQQLDFFFGDERYVLPTDSQSNYLMAKTALFDPLKIEPAHILAVDTTLIPEESAESYAASILDYFGHREMEFDIILLGLGDNAHTASLFPHTTVLTETTPSVKAVFLQDQQVYRITFTAPLINLAHNIIFLVYGSSKATAVQQVVEGSRDANNFPAQLVNTGKGNIQWFIDEAAASGL
jgi:6-phosphogluconolactonase